MEAMSLALTAAGDEEVDSANNQQYPLKRCNKHNYSMSRVPR